MGKYDDTPMGDLARLKQRVIALGEMFDMPLERMLVENDKDPNGEHFLHVTFRFVPEQVFKTDEQRIMDKEFEQIARQSALEDTETKIEEAREGAKDILDDLLGKGKGILDDPDPE